MKFHLSDNDAVDFREMTEKVPYRRVGDNHDGTFIYIKTGKYLFFFDAGDILPLIIEPERQHKFIPATDVKSITIEFEPQENTEKENKDFFQ